MECLVTDPHRGKCDTHKDHGDCVTITLWRDDISRLNNQYPRGYRAALQQADIDR